MNKYLIIASGDYQIVVEANSMVEAIECYKYPEAIIQITLLSL